jgi:hypothetical protein
MAEREGFEPSNEISPVTRLAGERLQPTRPSLRIPDFFDRTLRISSDTTLRPIHGGGSRIRTYGPFRDNGFQDRLLKPLGHPSDGAYHNLLAKINLRVKIKLTYPDETICFLIR